MTSICRRYEIGNDNEKKKDLFIIFFDTLFFSHNKYTINLTLATHEPG